MPGLYPLSLPVSQKLFLAGSCSHSSQELFPISEVAWQGLGLWRNRGQGAALPQVPGSDLVLSADLERDLPFCLMDVFTLFFDLQNA